MGTALASFVAGALIVFTMFDQTQVTRVDALEGSIREMQVEIQSQRDAEPLRATRQENKNRVESLTAESLREAREYLVYLEREKDRIPERRQMANNRVSFFASMIAETRSTLSAMEKLLDQIRSDPEFEAQEMLHEAETLNLRLKQQRANVHAFLLQVHLTNRAKEKTRSEEHYEGLLTTIEKARNDLSGLDVNLSRSQLYQKVNNLEQHIVPLKRQSPYTLLMMRIVEIGLPILLSFFSFFFITRYSLTEERLQEIKHLLKARNASRKST